MSKNNNKSKPTTQAYFVKRLRDSGYPIDNVTEYLEEDKRKWTVIMGRNAENVMITCYKNGNLEFYDGNQFSVNPRLLLNTDSLEVIMEHLHDLGFSRKHPSYGTKSFRKEEYARTGTEEETGSPEEEG